MGYGGGIGGGAGSFGGGAGSDRGRSGPDGWGGSSRGGSDVDAALKAGDWAGAMNAAFGAGGWGRDASGQYGAPGGYGVGAFRDGVYGLDRFGNVSKLGTRSRLGGMMTTARGWQGQYGQVGVGDKRSSAYGGYRNNLRDRIVERANKKQAAMRGLLGQITNRSTANVGEFVDDIMRAQMGEIGALKNKGYDVSEVANTHTAHSGMLGSFAHDFGWTGGDDVRTISEDAIDMLNQGQISVDTKTGKVSTKGYGPLNPIGMLTSVTAPKVAQKAAEEMYGLSNSIPAAMATKKGVSMAMTGLSRKAQPDALAEYTKGFLGAAIPNYGSIKNKAVDFMSSVPTSALSAFTGLPVGTIGQMVQGMNTAATLNSLGITAPGDPEARTVNDAPWEVV